MRPLSPEQLARVEARRAAEAAALAAFRVTMADVAALLGWPAGSEEYQAARYQAGGMAFTARFDDGKRRISITGYLPGELGRHARGETITVAANRPAPQIAQEIRRRLLPPMEQQLARARVAEDTRLASEAATRATAARIAAAGASEVYGGGSTGYHDAYKVALGTRLGPGHRGPYGTATIVYADRVEMQLRDLPPELAEHIASLLGEYRTERE
jgi:hypothetical protein